MDIVGRHFIYTYDNGWRYEMYVKSRTTIDYRIHSGIVGGRWVKHQTIDLVRLAADVYKLSWTEPTGTSVCVNVMPGQRRIHGVIFFPRWVHEHPERTVLFQNDHLPKMERFRDEGPTYPIHIISEFATITFIETCASDDDTVIACPPDQLPAGYADRRN
jgi:phenolic acid decarboxylase